MTAVQHHEIDSALFDQAIALLTAIREHMKDAPRGAYQVCIDKHLTLQIEQLLDTYYGAPLAASMPAATPAYSPDPAKDAFYQALVAEFPDEGDALVLFSLRVDHDEDGQLIAVVTWADGDEWLFWREAPAWRIQRPDGHVLAAPQGWLRRAFYTAVHLCEIVAE